MKTVWAARLSHPHGAMRFFLGCKTDGKGGGVLGFLSSRNLSPRVGQEGKVPGCPILPGWSRQGWVLVEEKTTTLGSSP